MDARMIRKYKGIGPSGGFSLVEVIMAIAIIGIICAIAIPFFGGFIDNRDLRNAARDLAGDVFEYKERAMAENRPYQIVYNAATSSYRINQCNGVNDSLCAAGYSTIATKVPAQFRKGISMTQATIGTLQFQPRGTATPNGAITLSNDRGSTATITISSTGRTYVQYALK